MTESEINRKLAEWVEPRPRWKDQPITMTPSDGKAWHGRFSTNGVYELAEPVDFFHSEDASALLLDRLLVDEYDLDFSQRQSGWVKLTLWHGLQPERTTLIKPNRKAAVAHAALALIAAGNGE